VEVYFPGNEWQVFDPTPAAPENSGNFLTRLGNTPIGCRSTWSEWVIGYDFAHQLVLAQNLQQTSKSWSETARNWFLIKQRASRK